MARPRRILNDCPSRKLGFASRAKANKWVRQRKRHNALHPFRSYQCPRCGLWHLTSRRR